MNVCVCVGCVAGSRKNKKKYIYKYLHSYDLSARKSATLFAQVQRLRDPGTSAIGPVHRRSAVGGRRGDFERREPGKIERFGTAPLLQTKSTNSPGVSGADRVYPFFFARTGNGRRAPSSQPRPPRRLPALRPFSRYRKKQKKNKKI